VTTPRAVVESVVAQPLAVELREPFVIATARLDRTRSLEVRATLRARGARVVGLGEAPALPPVTREDEVAALDSIRRAASLLTERPVTLDGLEQTLDEVLGDAPVARAGIETAILDALARLEGVPLRRLLGGHLGERTRELVTDITIPIAATDRMIELAREWSVRGFAIFKVKVGKDLDADTRALVGIHCAVPGAALRLDANAGFTAKEALELVRTLERANVPVECFEQPCAPGDLEGMAEVARALATPVIADESVATLHDLASLLVRGCVDGVNLKLAKSGGPLRSLALGRAARQAGMLVMVGGMVETRLGMTAAAHVACALGGADFVDLDTAWLLAGDPYAGGYRAEGPRYDLGDTPGLGVEGASAALAAAAPGNISTRT
jgi:L-Ala-D/L-Glu epimerase / N-acetyl-D-glutamate racemase